MKVINVFIIVKVILETYATILTSKIELGGYKRSFNPTNVNPVDVYFANIIDRFWPLTIFAKRSILDVWHVSEYPFATLHTLFAFHTSIF